MIYNTATGDDKLTITNVKFIGNNAKQSAAYYNGGGAILNTGGNIDTITGEFINNTTKSQGGAIHNTQYGEINSIVANFTGNSMVGANRTAYGGAINVSYNAHIGSIKGNFTDNYVSSNDVYIGGGAITITNAAVVDYIEGNFTNNYVLYNGTGTSVMGGAMELFLI